NLYHDPKYAKTVADLKLLLDKLQRESGDTPVTV
ncbi:MAG: hypothetical protein JWP63_1136, partial [Candidatus Solibacter sp.]|nr:hypothetical protein [Candidatus Solibacter sp.]